MRKYVANRPAKEASRPDDVLSDDTFFEGPPPFTLVGYAGTGKTTIVSSLIAELTETGVSVAVCAFTGKAASVLNKKLLAAGITTVSATTIHRLLYSIPNDVAAMLNSKLDVVEKAIEDGDDSSSRRAERQDLLDKLQVLGRRNSLRFGKKNPHDVRLEADVIICDEASMVDAEIAGDFASTGLPVIYVGDPNQLPPVGKAFGVNFAKPNALLDQIMRQEGDSGIIPFAHSILKTGRLPSPSESFAGVTRDASTNVLRFIGKDGVLPQYVVYYNRTRHQWNRDIRLHHFKMEREQYLPFVGERLLIDANLPAQRLLKGDIVTVKEIQYASRIDFADGFKEKPDPYTAVATVTDSYGSDHSMELFLNDLMLTMSAPDAIQPGDTRGLHRVKVENAVPVMFPYAVTCYKAQGSEWDKVVVYNEKPDRTYLQYIYTAVTRAAKELVVVK